MGAILLLCYPLKAAASDRVEVNVSTAYSTLSYRISTADIASATNIPSINYRIIGTIERQDNSSDGDLTYVSLSSLTLSLRNGSSVIPVRISGVIGGTPASTTPTRVYYNNKTASINLTGDLDESAIPASAAAGTYSGSLTITANLL